jgi:excisionase family DNA binding protein
MKYQSRAENRDEDRWMDTHQVSAYTGLSDTTIKRAVYSGSLRVSRVTGKHLFRRSWVDRWLEER